MERKSYWNFPERTQSGKKTRTDAVDTTPCTPVSIAGKVPEMLARTFAVTAVERTPHKTTLTEEFESLEMYSRERSRGSQLVELLDQA